MVTGEVEELLLLGRHLATTNLTATHHKRSCVVFTMALRANTTKFSVDFSCWIIARRADEWAGPRDDACREGGAAR